MTRLPASERIHLACQRRYESHYIFDYWEDSLAGAVQAMGHAA
ncbi:MAG: hypothetical protein M5U31_14875 [Acidimicrobiia bacterium]|nr:hypothetical protein [Acidimicrobiia bacterium]